jgi:hypothetical protein
MNLEYFSADLQDLFRLLEIHKVKYLVVGGEAVIYHGHARLTGDIDIFFERSIENTHRLFEAFMDFWQDSPPGIESGEELTHTGMIFQFGVPPNRIDFVNEIDGVSFDECWPSRIVESAESPEGAVGINYIGLRELQKNKEDMNFLKRAIAKDVKRRFP